MLDTNRLTPAQLSEYLKLRIMCAEGFGLPRAAAEKLQDGLLTRYYAGLRVTRDYYASHPAEVEEVQDYTGRPTVSHLTDGKDIPRVDRLDFTPPVMVRPIDIGAYRQAQSAKAKYEELMGGRRYYSGWKPRPDRFAKMNPDPFPDHCGFICHVNSPTTPDLRHIRKRTWQIVAKYGVPQSTYGTAAYANTRTLH